MAFKLDTSDNPRRIGTNLAEINIIPLVDVVLVLNDRRVPPGGLDAALRQAFATRKDKTLYLKADAGLNYGAVIETMDRVRRAGIESLGMVTEPVGER